MPNYRRTRTENNKRNGNRWASNSRRTSNDRHTFRGSNTVHVNNLPFDVTKSELRGALAFFGTVTDSLIHKPKPAQLLGDNPFTFAFVNFDNPDDTRRCIESRISIEIRGYVATFNSRLVPGEETRATRSTVLGSLVRDMGETKASESQGEADKRLVIAAESGIAHLDSSSPAGNWASLSDIDVDVLVHHSSTPKKAFPHDISLSPPGTSINNMDRASDNCFGGISYTRPESARSCDSSLSLVVNMTNNRRPLSSAATSGGILLIDRIPGSWSAQLLFERLSFEIAGVVSVLIYQDQDERGFHQGLLQLDSEPLCTALCERGTIQIEEATLDIMRSEVKSIGLLKRRYTGKFTVYDPPRDEYPTTSAGPVESPTDSMPTSDNCIDHEAFWDQRISALPTFPAGERAFGRVDDASPMDAPDFTPTTDFTPATDIYCEEKTMHGPAFGHGQALHTLKNKNNQYQTNFATFIPQSAGTISHSVMPVYMPMPVTYVVPMVASSTIIIDNIEPKGKENLQGQLERLGLKMGGTCSVDMAKTGSTYRAFICYQSPNQACASLQGIQKHYQDSSVSVRFA